MAGEIYLPTAGSDFSAFTHRSHLAGATTLGNRITANQPLQQVTGGIGFTLGGENVSTLLNRAAQLGRARFQAVRFDLC